jgi:hypothetical protein
MKRLILTGLVICLVVFLASPGLAGDKYRMRNYGPAGPGGKVQHVTANFVHYTPSDQQLWPTPGPPPLCESFSDFNRCCRITRANSIALSGDIVGDNPLLSDVACLNSADPTTATGARIEAVGWLEGILFGREEIKMFGRMTLDIDRTITPPEMTGYWIFEEGVGTHYGFFQVKGEVVPPKGLGTYTGWVRKNK